MKIESLEIRKTVDNLSQELQELMLKIYPVGSLYFSTTNNNPSSFLGGEWNRYGNGKAIVGVDESDTSFDVVNKTGGEKTHTLTVNEMPSHTHVFTAKEHNHTLNNHTHTVKEHSHTLSATTGKGGKHSHDFSAIGRVLYWDAGLNSMGGLTSGTTVQYTWASSTKEAGEHTHTLSGTTNTLAQFNTGGSNANTSNITVTGSNSNVGGSISHNNLQPYITCYIWKRVK